MVVIDHFGSTLKNPNGIKLSKHEQLKHQSLQTGT